MHPILHITLLHIVITQVLCTESAPKIVAHRALSHGLGEVLFLGRLRLPPLQGLSSNRLRACISAHSCRDTS